MENEINLRKSSLIARLWESAGIIAILSLVYSSNGKTIIEMIFNDLNIKAGSVWGINSINFIAIAVFLVVYFSSFKIFAKEPCTKLFSIAASFFMAVTLGSAILFA